MGNSTRRAQSRQAAFHESHTGIPLNVGLNLIPGDRLNDLRRRYDRILEQTDAGPLRVYVAAVLAQIDRLGSTIQPEVGR